jgi:TolB-like protein
MKPFVLAIVLMLGTATYAAPAKVLLLPFEAVGDATKPWVAKAVQQNLVAELSRVNSVTPATVDTGAADLNAALNAADKEKADFVVFGSYQAVDNELRITGQVVDVGKKQAVAGLKSTGSLRDLFGMEDVIATQVKRALPQPLVEAGPDMLKQPAAAQPPAEGEAPQQPAADAAANLDQRARELQDAIDRALDRIRYATPPDYGGAYYPPYDYGYGGYGYGYGVYAPIYYYPYFNRFHHRVIHHGPHSGVGVHGNFHGQNFNFHGQNVAGGFRAGNFASFGRMSASFGRMSR